MFDERENEKKITIQNVQHVELIKRLVFNILNAIYIQPLIHISFFLC